VLRSILFLGTLLKVWVINILGSLCESALEHPLL